MPPEKKLEVYKSISARIQKMSEDRNAEESFDAMESSIPSGGIMRVEGAMLSALQKMKKRDELKAYNGMVKELQNIPELCVPDPKKVGGSPMRYEIPNRGSGLTVRTAELIARHWGNCVWTASIEDSGKYTTVKGIYVDIDTNMMISVPKVVSRFKRVIKKDREGKAILVNNKKTYEVKEMDEDEFAIEVDRAASKARRNALLSGIPPFVKLGVEETIIELSKENIQSQKNRIISGFLGYGIKAGVLENYLGHNLDNLTNDEVVTLRDIYSAIKEHEISPENAFNLGDLAPEDSSPPKHGTAGLKEKMKVDATTPASPSPLKQEPVMRMTKGRVLDILAEDAMSQQTLLEALIKENIQVTHLVKNLEEWQIPVVNGLYTHPDQIPAQDDTSNFPKDSSGEYSKPVDIRQDILNYIGMNQPVSKDSLLAFFAVDYSQDDIKSTVREMIDAKTLWVDANKKVSIA